MSDILFPRLGIDCYPAYVRKLDKRSSWGHPSDQIEDRVADVADRVFPITELQFSLFLVSSDEDLERVVVGLNSTRQSSVAQVDLVAFKPEEFLGAGISIESTPGNTDCETANKLHVDIHAPSHSSFCELCRIVFAEERHAFRVQRLEAKGLAKKLKDFGCHAFPENNSSPCVKC